MGNLFTIDTTINPYYWAVVLAGNRLIWDLQPASWRARRRIRAARNRHQGQKAVVLCNGPSLADVDFDLLENVFTFGLNKINLLFDSVAFRPSCIVAVNTYVISQNRDFYNRTDIPLYLDRLATKWIKDRRNVVFVHTTPMPDFAGDCSMSLFQGYTVTYVALQLAYHMGFSEVALVGADHRYDFDGAPNDVAVAGGGDTSHFDPRYFNKGEQWQVPDLAGSERYYSLARQVYEAAGRRIVNATAGGCLEVFPRVDLREFLGREPSRT